MIKIFLQKFNIKHSLKNDDLVNLNDLLSFTKLPNDLHFDLFVQKGHEAMTSDPVFLFKSNTLNLY